MSWPKFWVGNIKNTQESFNCSKNFQKEKSKFKNVMERKQITYFIVIY